MEQLRICFNTLTNKIFPIPCYWIEEDLFFFSLYYVRVKKQTLVAVGYWESKQTYLHIKEAYVDLYGPKSRTDVVSLLVSFGESKSWFWNDVEHIGNWLTDWLCDHETPRKQNQSKERRGKHTKWDGRNHWRKPWTRYFSHHLIENKRKNICMVVSCNHRSSLIKNE